MSFDREQMVKVCGLFSSASDGECAAAARKASQLVEAAGKTWDDVISPPAYDERLSLAFELMERGWPQIAAAGIASALNVPVNGECPNLARWRDARWSQLLDWSNRSNHVDYTTLKSQIDYLNYNLVFTLD